MICEFLKPPSKRAKLTGLELGSKTGAGETVDGFGDELFGLEPEVEYRFPVVSNVVAPRVSSVIPDVDGGVAADEFFDCDEFPTRLSNSEMARLSIEELRGICVFMNLEQVGPK